jgi:hypothetical protein
MIFKKEHTGNTPSGSKKFETLSEVWSMDPLETIEGNTEQLISMPHESRLTEKETYIIPSK